MPNMQTAYQKWQGIWSRRRLTLVFGTAYALLSIFAMIHFLNSSYLGERYYMTSYEGMYNGTTNKPFVYRQLIPSLSRAITAISPDVLQQPVNDAVEWLKTDPSLNKWRVTMPWVVPTFPKAGEHYPRVVSILLIYGCLWGYIWALGRLARQLFPISPAMGCFAPVFGLLLISSFSRPFQYTYDIPVLFLSTACYLFIAQGRWGLYLACFALASINKETSIFIFLFFAIWCWKRIDQRRYINLMVAQYLIYAVIRVALLYIYQDNTGDYLRNHLFRLMPGDLLTQSSYERIMKVAWMFFLLTYQWGRKPAFLKCGLLLLPPMYLAFLLYGLPHEYRVFFDVLPLPLLLGVHTLVECTGLARAPFFMPASLSKSSGENYDPCD